MAWVSSRVNSASISTTSSRTTGSKPLVASSKISSFASWDRATASPSFIFMPLENSLNFWFSGRENLVSSR